MKQIIDLEYNFLDTLNSQEYIDLHNNFCSHCNQDNGCDASCKFDILVNEHNNSILCIAKEINEIIFKALDINDTQRYLISENLDNYGLFNFIDF